MTSFSIILSKEKFEYEGEWVASGSLKVGSLTEDFHASLSYWDREKYLSQWKEALNRLLRGESRSAIVTTMYDPQTANFILWWVMYLIGGNVYVQNHVLFLDELTRPFDEQNLYSFIPDREEYTEEGELISEWVIKITDIKRCISFL
ncbi:hypothetical protein BZG79_15505 [Salinivibrio sp. MA427]|uniref:hypothetical protein n=1 Tax=Salinivibrio sp. MA427 TaxID=1909455 RepID=UPI00098B95F3|nr:hypothetical protein [Salinivibrio sp. MA427]OOF01017.1 hypothetical protein BZG79_15505 [Salinivibrio sp. MA427]